MYKIISLITIGIIVGIIRPYVGGGADVIIVPLLLLFGITLNIKTAIGMSLVSLLPPMGITAVYQFYKNKLITMKDVYYSLYMIPFFAIASYYSSNLAMDINKETLKKIYGFFLIVVGIISFKY